MENKILFINACARQNSRTYELAQYFLSLFDSNITQVDLYKTKILPIGSKELEKRTLNIKNNNFYTNAGSGRGEGGKQTAGLQHT